MRRPPDIIDIFLQPGEYFIGDASYTIRTLLGSCVSITLWQPGRRIGAMSHFLLPFQTGATRDVVAPEELDGRYGEDALLLMMAELRQAGVEPSQCESKLFGGANMFPRHASSATMHIGRRNGEVARRLLHAHGIPVVSEHLYGTGHRQIIFRVATGEVWSRQLPPADMQRTSAA